MSVYALCGGGTAGHITPLIAVFEQLARADKGSRFVVIGTESGRERELLPGELGDIVALPKLPYPRRLGAYALGFVPRWIASVFRVRRELIARGVDVVVGFGGYTAAPVYLASWLARIPLVIHEANAVPGMANKLGARLTRYVAVCFAGTPLPHPTVVGMPLRAEIVRAAKISSVVARKHFGLSPRKPVLLVTGGSTGAQSINRTIEECRADLVDSGWQVLHLIGKDNTLPTDNPKGFVSLGYTDRMDLAMVAADFVVSRAGAATVSELEVVGKPAVFIPYHVGNGEQRKNAAGAVESGAALLVTNDAFRPEWVRGTLVPLLADSDRVAAMALSMAARGVTDGAKRVAEMAIDAGKGV